MATLFSGSDAGAGPKGIAYVSTGDLLIWADGASGVIKQASAAGTGSVTTLVSGLVSAASLWRRSYDRRRYSNR